MASRNLVVEKHSLLDQDLVAVVVPVVAYAGTTHITMQETESTLFHIMYVAWRNRSGSMHIDM